MSKKPEKKPESDQQPIRFPVKSMLQPKIQNALRREFGIFFRSMLTTEKGWPAISDEDFVDALADAVMTVGSNGVRGTAMLQTLIYELQERVNHQLASA